MQFSAMSFVIFPVHCGPQYLSSSDVNWLLPMWRGRPRPRLLRLLLPFAFALALEVASSSRAHSIDFASGFCFLVAQRFSAAIRLQIHNGL
jgi:hypothetical protein